MRRFSLTLLLSILLLPSITGAQAVAKDTSYKVPQISVRKLYLSAAFDLGLLSSSTFSKPGTSQQLTVPRFSPCFNFTLGINYDFNPHFGLFTGVNIKNIGLIEQDGDSSIKRRVYTIGAPLGLRFGNLSHTYGILGGGLDIPFNYREKGFVHRGDKQKFNEWFSDRTPHVMPYLFAGARVSGFVLKAQYYPTNFFNENYKASNGVYSYYGYSANLFYLSIGFDIPVNRIRKEQYDEED